LHTAIALLSVDLSSAAKNPIFIRNRGTPVRVTTRNRDGDYLNEYLVRGDTVRNSPTGMQSGDLPGIFHEKDPT
jgi:hypothetical protein